MISSENLISLLPHRPPMLFLDGAEPPRGDTLVAYQVIRSDSPLLKGHFPEFPVWPGSTLLEGMAQTAALLFLHQRGSLSPDEIPLLGAMSCRFFAPVLPGDIISYHAELIRRVQDNALFNVLATRKDKLVARARITAGIRRSSILLREEA